MARKDLTIIFGSTEPKAALNVPADNSDLLSGNVRATRVGLREVEISALDQRGVALSEYMVTEKIARSAC